MSQSVSPVIELAISDGAPEMLDSNGVGVASSMVFECMVNALKWCLCAFAKAEAIEEGSVLRRQAL